jgi:hypothetical protein
LQFNDPAAEMFTFTVTVRGYFPDPSGSAGAGGTAGSSGGSGGTSTGSSSGSGFSLPVRVMKVTINPLTRSVTTQLL